MDREFIPGLPFPGRQGFPDFFIFGIPIFIPIFPIKWEQPSPQNLISSWDSSAMDVAKETKFGTEVA